MSKITKLSRPKLVGSDSFSVRYHDEIDQDLNRMESEKPDGGGKQPPKKYDEVDAAKEGPSTPSLKMKMMAKGGMINKAVSMDEAEEDGAEHPEGLEETDSSQGPPEDEYMADHFAKGGMVDEEEETEQHASIAAAIMARNADKKLFADGGFVDIEENGKEQPNQYYKLYKAALKENLDSDMSDVSQPMDSNEHGDELTDEDMNSMSKIQKIMHRMSKKSPITK